MYPSGDFRRHAATCRNMAGVSSDTKNQKEWNAIATRWDRSAQWYDVVGGPLEAPAGAQEVDPPHGARSPEAGRNQLKLSNRAQTGPGCVDLLITRQHFRFRHGYDG